MKRLAAAASAAVLLAAEAGNPVLAEDTSSVPTPVLSMPKIVLSEDDVKANRNVTVSLTLKGADRKYSTFEIWTKFDERLVMPVDSEGIPEAVFGSSVTYMNKAVAANSYYDHKKNELVTINGVRAIGASHKDLGFDGILFSITLTLPEDASAGDIYPLSIITIDKESANNDYVGSTFMNSAHDETGIQMQDWLFSKGLRSGYIKITADGTDSSYGDVTGDGNVSASDIVAALQYAANSVKYPIDDELLVNGDVNGDKVVNAQDAFLIQQYDAKVIDHFPVEEKV